MKAKYQNSGRVFSTELKKRQVGLLDRGLITVAQICREFDVTDSAVRKWIRKYSLHHQHKTRVVIEMESEEKKTKELLAYIAELERAVGKQQLKIAYLETLIEVGSEELGVDLKKNAARLQSNGSGSTPDHPPGK